MPMLKSEFGYVREILELDTPIADRVSRALMRISVRRLPDRGEEMPPSAAQELSIIFDRIDQDYHRGDDGQIQSFVECLTPSGVDDLAKALLAICDTIQGQP